MIYAIFKSIFIIEPIKLVIAHVSKCKPNRSPFYQRLMRMNKCGVCSPEENIN